MRINAKNNDKIDIKRRINKDEVRRRRNRISKAEMHTKLKKIWNSNNITRKIKIKLYRTLVLPMLLKHGRLIKETIK